MDKNEKLSIVIPAYNAGWCIERCLNSIMDQNYHNDLEIIVVNDGSTDSTSKVIDAYCQKYASLFRVVNKQNGGVPSARNAGLEVALGDWIWFCDADDYICKNGLSYVLDHFVDSSIDVCTFHSISLDPIALKRFNEQNVVKGECLFEGSTIEKYKKDFPIFVWNHIYRHDAIRGVRFENVTMCEDMLFNLEVYMKNLRIKCTNSNIYRYTMSDSQLTRKRDKNTMLNAINSYELLFERAKCYQAISSDHVLKEGIDRMVAHQMSPYFSRILCANLTRRDFSKRMDTLWQKGILPINAEKRTHHILNFLSSHPSLYPLESCLYYRVFIPLILPRLSRN